MPLNSFSHLLREEQQPTNNTEPNNDDEDDLESEGFRDTRSEGGSDPESEYFYTAANNSAETLSLPDTGTGYFAEVPQEIANARWAAPLRQHQPVLKRIYQERVAAGLSPDWPFADFLEFEFVKWMVVNDVSQTARDKLIKLPIVRFQVLSVL